MRGRAHVFCILHSTLGIVSRVFSSDDSSFPGYNGKSNMGSLKCLASHTELLLSGIRQQQKIKENILALRYGLKSCYNSCSFPHGPKCRATSLPVFPGRFPVVPLLPFFTWFRFILFLSSLRLRIHWSCCRSKYQDSRRQSSLSSNPGQSTLGSSAINAYPEHRSRHQVCSSGVKNVKCKYVKYLKYKIYKSLGYNAFPS